MDTNVNPYEELANAIVLQAAKDYRDLLANRVAPTKHRNITELEQFFSSGYFTILTKLDGEVLMAKLREEVSSDPKSWQVYSSNEAEDRKTVHQDDDVHPSSILSVEFIKSA